MAGLWLFRGHIICVRLLPGFSVVVGLIPEPLTRALQGCAAPRSYRPLGDESLHLQVKKRKGKVKRTELEGRMQKVWRPGLSVSPGAAQAWTRGRGLVEAWPAQALIGCPEAQPENKALEPSVLPTFCSSRIQTQSTPLAHSVQLLLCRVRGPSLSLTPGLTAWDSQSRVLGKGRGAGTHSVLHVLICKMGRWHRSFQLTMSQECDMTGYLC